MTNHRGRISRRRLLIGIVIVAVAMIFGFTPLIPFMTPGAEDDIREAVIRHYLRDVTSRETYFVQIDQKDPSPDFMARFQDVDWRLKPASFARFHEPGHAVFDPETGEDASILDVYAIEWGSPFTVEATCSSYSACLGAVWVRYRLRWQLGSWVVVEDRLTLIADLGAPNAGEVAHNRSHRQR